MKTTTKMIWAMALFVCLLACKKDSKIIYTSSGSLTITNAVMGGSALALDSLNFQSVAINNNSYKQVPLVAGVDSIDLFVPAVPTTLTTPGTPAVTYYDQPLTVNNNDNYSLFLTGASPGAVDNVLIKESYGVYSDSVCGVRFINLSTGSSPMSVDVMGMANGSEVSSLAYKGYDNFIQHSAGIADVNTGITFEIRDAETGTLLTTYTLSPPTFKNVTLAISGSPVSPGIILVNNY